MQRAVVEEQGKGNRSALASFLTGGEMELKIKVYADKQRWIRCSLCGVSLRSEILRLPGTIGSYRYKIDSGPLFSQGKINRGSSSIPGSLH